MSTIKLFSHKSHTLAPCAEVSATRSRPSISGFRGVYGGFSRFVVTSWRVGGFLVPLGKMVFVISCVSVPSRPATLQILTITQTQSSLPAAEKSLLQAPIPATRIPGQLLFDFIQISALVRPRRNMEPFQRIETALRLKDVIAVKAKDRQRAAGGDRVSDSAKALCPTLDKALPVDTEKELASAANVSHGTLAKGVYICKNADEETKNKLRKGEKCTPINKE